MSITPDATQSRVRAEPRGSGRSASTVVCRSFISLTTERNMKDTPDALATKTWVLALTSMASFMAALDAMVVATALGTIRLDLGASIETLECTVNAYNLAFAVLLLTGAALGDRFGRRRLFATGLALFAAAS